MKARVCADVVSVQFVPIQPFRSGGSAVQFYRSRQVLDKLFFGEFRSNNDIHNILIKCCTLNDFYSTHIFSVYSVAKHILKLNIDESLNKGDESLVEKIANIDIVNNKGKLTHHCFYSFASKYCSHHNPKAFPVFDSYVEKILKHFRRDNENFQFRNEELKNYPSFKKVLLRFQELYGITKYVPKDLDRYLWQLGKDFYSNNY